MSDWLEALRVASESPAIDLVTAGVLDDLRHALVVGRLVDRETLCGRRSCEHPIDHHTRSKNRCLHDCGCPAVWVAMDE